MQDRIHGSPCNGVLYNQSHGVERSRYVFPRKKFKVVGVECDQSMGWISYGISIGKF